MNTLRGIKTQLDASIVYSIEVTMFNAQSILRHTLDDGGYTVHLEGYTPDRGYLVGTRGYELKVKLEDFTVNTIKGYVKTNSHKLHGNNYLGTWVDNGYVYLDISQLVIGYTKALEKGLANNQLAVYDCEHKAVIEIKRG